MSTRILKLAARAGTVVLALTAIACVDGSTVQGNDPPPPPPPPPPPSSANADPTLLPVATKQNPDKAAYTALNVRGLPSGGSYRDPVTGVTIYKLTSATAGVSNTAAIQEYFEGGPFLSRPWGANLDNYTVAVYYPYQSTTRLVDFNRTTGAVTNWRPAPEPGTEGRRAWSYKAAEPQVQYAVVSGVLRKYNTAGSGAPAELSGGGFPKDLSAQGGSLGDFVWLSSSLSDWFVMMPRDQKGLVAYNSATGQVLVRAFSGLDEPKLEHDGRYVWVRHNDGNTIWDLETNTVSAFKGDGAIYKGHAGMARGYAFGADVNQSVPRLWRVQLSSMDATPVFQGAQGTSYEVNNSGNWVDQGSAGNAWVFHGANTGADYASSLYRHAAGILRLDGSDYRLLCHTYSEGSDYYTAQNWPHASQDGKIVLFKSNMNGAARADLFVALVPTRPE